MVLIDSALSSLTNLETQRSIQVLCEKGLSTKVVPVATWISWKWVKTNDDLGRDLHRDHLPILRYLMCLVCLITDTYVGMLSPVLGSEVLCCWGTGVATDHVSCLEVQPWSDHQTINTHLASCCMPGMLKVCMFGTVFSGLCQLMVSTPAGAFNATLAIWAIRRVGPPKYHFLNSPWIITECPNLP